MIDGDGRILLQRRAVGREMAGLWEFPGGKVEAGERPEAALVRELAEELGIEADEAALVPGPFASANNGGRRMLLLLYLCREWRGDPQALDADALCWVDFNNMKRLAMPPADVPLVAMLEKLLAG
jgi:8-oxo-dGTP diphosphatase